MTEIFKITIVFERLPDPDLSLDAYAHLHSLKKNRLLRAARKEAFNLASVALRENTTWSAPLLAGISYEFYSVTHEVKDLDGYLVPACKPWLIGLCDAGLLLAYSGWNLRISSACLMVGRNQTRLIIEPY